MRPTPFLRLQAGASVVPSGVVTTAKAKYNRTRAGKASFE